MLFLTLNQANVWWIFVYFGIIVGATIFVVNIFLKKLRPKINKKQILEKYLIKTNNTTNIKNNKKQVFVNFVYHTIWCIEIIFSCVVFFVILYNYNFGQVRLFCFAAYVLGILIAYQIIKCIIKIIVKIKIKKLLKN